jgi:hypothetical protein
MLEAELAKEAKAAGATQQMIKEARSIFGICGRTLILSKV